MSFIQRCIKRPWGRGKLDPGNLTKGIMWTILTAAFSALLPSLVKLIYAMKTGDENIELYGYTLTRRIDAVHLTAGYCTWLTVLVAVWCVKAVYEHFAGSSRHLSMQYINDDDEETALRTQHNDNAIFSNDPDSPAYESTCN